MSKSVSFIHVPSWYLGQCGDVCLQPLSHPALGRRKDCCGLAALESGHGVFTHRTLLIFCGHVFGHDWGHQQDLDATIDERLLSDDCLVVEPP